MIETAAKHMNSEGKFVVISGSQTAENLGKWRDRIKARMKDFPKMELADVVYCDDSQPIAMDLAKQMLNKHKDLKLIMAICSPAVPGSADAVRSAQRSDVKVIGIYSSPSLARAGLERLRTKPGFCDQPDGFSVDPYNLDADHWTEGFGID
jgi:ABC-type sugar transport system substrate-binding protein